MSHHLYQTECIVLGSRNIGESNRLFFLLTKDLGLVVGSAQGIRELKGKLRYSLQDFRYIRVELVRGKEMWRITNAAHLSDFHTLLGDKEKTALVARVSLLIQRLIHGEARDLTLFNVLYEFLKFLEKEELGTEELHSVEVLVNLKVLHLLGYGSEREIFRPFYLLPPSKDLLSHMAPVKKMALSEINRALQESHL
ncbi:MAG: DNA repair protein RecO [Patescibacteria group bacterium]